MTSSSSRRDVLRLGAGISALGAGAPFALQLAAAGPAAAAVASDYRAVVVMFMAGGWDTNNVVLATDGAPVFDPHNPVSPVPYGTGNWGRYARARTSVDRTRSIALLPPNWPAEATDGPKDRPRFWGGALPITPRTPQTGGMAYVDGATRTFAVHPLMKDLFSAGGASPWEQNRLAILANVGTLVEPVTKAKINDRTAHLPAQIGSHSDQQTAWQSAAIEPATGWGGRMADRLLNLNSAHPVFTAISTYGNNLYLTGNLVGSYAINTAPDGDLGVAIDGLGSSSIFGSSLGRSALSSIINTTNGPSRVANEYGLVVGRSISATAAINAAVATAPDVPAPPAFIDPVTGDEGPNPWTQQLFAIGRVIAASATSAPGLGLKRQVFFAQVDSFDTHGDQSPIEAVNQAQISQALVYFDTLLATLGLQNNVTTMTASDFSRTFTFNSTGSDHAWGGHHLIMGGAVNGGDIYGTYPTLGIDIDGFPAPDFTGNNMIPTTSVDQYAATIARWFGVPEADLGTVFPNLGNFPTSNLGFMKL